MPDLRYAPSDSPPTDPKELAAWVQRELFAISDALRHLKVLNIQETNEAPDKTFDGDVRRADGTNWNPGSGAGLYWFNGSVWTKL